MKGRRLAVRRGLLLLGLSTLCVLAWPGAVLADDASVLPKGRSRIAVETFVYFPTEQRFNDKGDAEDIAAEFANVSVNSRVFTDLNNAALINALRAVGITALPSIGDANVEFVYDFTIVDVGLQYGITDRLTAGLSIPYWWVTNDVDFDFDSGPGTSANVGLNAAGTSFLPIALGGRRLTKDQVQQLLGPGIGPIQGFGFKSLKTWSDDGLGDISAGFKYQYLKTEDWQLAATGGVRFPTGRQDDPDDLTDVAFGTGAWSLLFRLHNDYVLSNLWKRPTADSALPEAGDLVLDGTFRYDLTLPDEATKRLGPTLTRNRERVDRDLGDKLELEVAGRYHLLKSLSLSALYRYGFRLEDQVSGTRHLDYRSLERDTDGTEHIYIVGLNYSTLPFFMEKKFPVPLSFSVTYRDRFAGTGPRSAQVVQTLKTRYVSFVASILF